MAGPFGATSTTDQVLEGIDLTGQRLLVTGASAGLGIETARTLAAHGAQVVGAARDLTKAEAATVAVRVQAKEGGGLDLVELDLASLASVRGRGRCLARKGQRLRRDHCQCRRHGLPQEHHGGWVRDAVRHQSPGSLCLCQSHRLLAEGRGKAGQPVLSGHRFSDVDLEDPNFEHTPYSEFGAYGRSKTANILFAVEFDRRHKARGVRATAVHPGGIQTELGRHLTPTVLQQLVDQLNATEAAAGRPPFQWKTVPQGAATTVWAGFVAGADEVGGLYCEDCHVAEPAEGTELRAGVRAYALDPEHARALWAKSEEMVGERF